MILHRRCEFQVDGFVFFVFCRCSEEVIIHHQAIMSCCKKLFVTISCLVGTLTAIVAEETHPLCWGHSHFAEARQRDGANFRSCCFGDFSGDSELHNICFNDVFTRSACCSQVTVAEADYCMDHIPILSVTGDAVSERRHSVNTWVSVWDFAYRLYAPAYYDSTFMSFSDQINMSNGDPLNLLPEQRWYHEHVWRMLSDRHIAKIVTADACGEVAELCQILLFESKVLAIVLLAARGAPSYVYEVALTDLLRDWLDMRYHLFHHENAVIRRRFPRTGLVHHAVNAVSHWFNVIDFFFFSTDSIRRFEARQSWLPIFESNSVPVGLSGWQHFYESWNLDRRIYNDSNIQTAHNEFFHSLQSIGVSLEHVIPTQGTLIGFLRHGSIQGMLADGITDIVDLDMDFVVIVQNAKRAYQFCFQLFENLSSNSKRSEERSQWIGCYVASNQNCACQRIFDDFSVFWVGLDFLVPNSTSTFSNASSAGIVNGSLWLDSFPMRENILTPLDGSDPVPADILYPTKQCWAYGKLIHCPSQPWSFLKGEYQSGDNFLKACLALPQYGVSRNSHDPRNLDLLTRGIVAQDLHILEDRWRFLEDRGALSMSAIWHSDSCLEQRQQLRSPDELSVSTGNKLVVVPELRHQSTIEKIEEAFLVRLMQDRSYNSLCFENLARDSHLHGVDQAEYCCSHLSSSATECFSLQQDRETCCQPHLHSCAGFVVIHFPLSNFATDDLLRDFEKTIKAISSSPLTLGSQDGRLEKYAYSLETEDPNFCPLVMWIHQHVDDVWFVCPEVVLMVRSLASARPTLCGLSHSSSTSSSFSNFLRDVMSGDTVPAMRSWAIAMVHSA